MTTLGLPTMSLCMNSPTYASTSLPFEVQRTIFLLLDPHSLYTSVRSLNNKWKETVEDHLLEQQFTSKNWRIALKVSRRFKHSNPSGGGPADAGGATPANNNMLQALDGLDKEDRLEKVLNMDGLKEDMLDELNENGETPELSSSNDSNLTSSSNSSFETKVKTHVIPLKFERYCNETTSLEFSTGEEWHALFEQPQEVPAHDGEVQDGQERITEVDPQEARLDLDFAIVWRFPGDGKDEDEEDEERERKRGRNGNNVVRNREREITREWGKPDPENNWLSRFHCSGYDISPAPSLPASRVPSPNSSEPNTPSKRLISTPLARRTRTKPSTPITIPTSSTNTSNSSNTASASRTRRNTTNQRTAILRREVLNPEAGPKEAEGCDCCDHSHEESNKGNHEIDGVNSMIWSDKGHEYINLNLNLGIEFFVRRSAKANLLHRKLEEEAIRRFEDEEFEKMMEEKRIKGEAGLGDVETPVEIEDDEEELKIVVSSDDSELVGSSIKDHAPSNPSGSNSENLVGKTWNTPWALKGVTKPKISSTNNPDPYSHLPFIHRPKPQTGVNKLKSGNASRTSSPLSGLSRSNSIQKNLSSLVNVHANDPTSPPPSRTSLNGTRSSTPNPAQTSSLNGSSEISDETSKKAIASQLFSKKHPGLKQGSGGKLVTASLPVTPSFSSTLRNSSVSIQNNLNRTNEALLLSNNSSSVINRGLNLPTPAQSNFAAMKLKESFSNHNTRPSSRTGFHTIGNVGNNHSDGLSAMLSDMGIKNSNSGTGTPRARFRGRIFRAEEMKSSPSPKIKTLAQNSSSSPGANGDGKKKCSKCLAKETSSFPNGGAWEPDPEELVNKPDREGWVGGDLLGRGQVRMAFDEDGKEESGKAYVWEWSR